MDSKDDDRLSQCYRLLALCARAESHPLMQAQLSRQVEVFNAWDELPAQAELHGMAPLLWHHLRKADISIPPNTEQTLKGLYLRHRVFNQVQTQVLIEITTLFEQAGVRAVLLKGLALAYGYYPDPALRPASDIDLLLKKDDILPALDLLKKAGFKVNSHQLGQTSDLLPKELTVDSPLRNGFSTHVELHHYDPRLRTIRGNNPDNEFRDFDAQPIPLKIGERVVYVPSPLETLNYLCRHFERHLFHARADKPQQLKWMADIVTLAERHARIFEWDDIKKNNPNLLERLDVFYSLTPMPRHMAGIIPVKQTPVPVGLNQYPKGWPQNSIKATKQVGFLRFLLQTLTLPSIWWLRLYYGINTRSCFWYGQIIYRTQIFWYGFLILAGKKERK